MTCRQMQRWAPLGLAVAATFAARVFLWRVLGDVPHVMDEIAYTFQARTFAGGHVTAPVALPRAAFALWFVDDRVAKFSIFPPGWPLLLAIGMKVGLGAWVNPLLHGATTWVVAQIGRRLAGRRAPTLAAALYGFSPQAMILAASFMSHTAVAFAAASAWLLLLVAHREAAAVLRAPGAGLAPRTARLRRALFVAGAAVGMTLLVRPLCGAVVLFVAACLVLNSAHRYPVIRRAIWLAVVPVVLSLVALGTYNRVLTGDARRFPQTMWFDEHAPPSDAPVFSYHPGCNALGLGKAHGCELSIGNDGHTAKNALSNTGDNLRAWTLLACGGPLLVVGTALAFRRRRFRRLRGLALTVLPAVIVAYALYWYAGVCYGARFYHAALPTVVALMAIGIAEVSARAVRVTLVALAFAINGLALRGATAELGVRYWGVDARFAELKTKWSQAPALVMVAFREKGAPAGPSGITSVDPHDPASVQPNGWRALSALAANGPAMDDRVLFAKFHPALVPELRARFGGRRFYLYVMSVDARDDRIEPYDAARFPDLGSAPAANFDGFVVP